MGHSLFWNTLMGIHLDVLFIFLDILCVVFNVPLGNALKGYSSNREVALFRECLEEVFQQL